MGGHFSVQSEFLGRSASSSALRSSSGKGAISRQQHALTWLVGVRVRARVRARARARVRVRVRVRVRFGLG